MRRRNEASRAVDRAVEMLKKAKEIADLEKAIPPYIVDSQIHERGKDDGIKSELERESIL